MTIEARLARKLAGNTTIGELVGTAGLGGYGFNAVRRNVRFAPEAAIEAHRNVTRVTVFVFRLRLL